jgi:hypothetical protein
MFPANRLTAHFRNLCNGQVVQIPQLTKDLPYPVVGARRFSAAYGHTVMYTFRTEGDILLRIYLPRRYANDIDSDDIDAINQGRINCKLVYLGMAVSRIC